MTPRPARATPAGTMRRAGRAAVAALAAVALATAAGCSWRAETAPIERRTPSPEVGIRDAAAEREQAVIDAAGTGGLARAEAALAPARLDALGGVYVPSPSASPSRAPALDLPEAAAAARDGALTDADAVAASDPSLALLLRSIALSHAVALAVDAAAGAAPAERVMPTAAGRVDALAPAASTSIDAETLAGLAVAHDRAGFAYEVAAANAVDDERAAALARARIHRDRAGALVAAPGVEDRRAELYAVDPAAVGTPEDRAALARGLESGLGWGYAALLDGADADDVGWLLNAAYDAYAQAASLPGFDAAADLPALPGLSVG